MLVSRQGSKNSTLFVHSIQALRVRDLERRLVEKLDQEEHNQQQHGDSNNANDRREQLRQALSDDEDHSANYQQEPPVENPPDPENPPVPENPPIPENLQNAENLPNTGNLPAQTARAEDRRRRGRKSLPDMLSDNQLQYPDNVMYTVLLLYLFTFVVLKQPSLILRSPSQIPIPTPTPTPLERSNITMYTQIYKHLVVIVPVQFD